MAKKSKKKKAEENPFALAISVSDRVDIIEVRLIDCNCHQTPEASQGKQLVDYNYSVETELKKEHSQILLFPTFKMTAKPDKTAGDEISLSIQARFLLAYKINSLKGITKKNIEAFGNVNGIYNAWPYWREFVQNTIARMGLPKLTIPVFRFGHDERTDKNTSKQTKKIATKKKAKKK
jgi:preprotein translocase subunit SecB